LSFLERIFGKKKEVTSEDLSEKKEEMQVFTVEDAESYLSKNFDGRFEPFKEDANRVYQEMQPIVTNMQKSLNGLAESKYDGLVDSELLQNVVAHRRSFIHKMEIMLERLKKPMQLDFDSILEYDRSISSAISEANQKTVIDYRFLKELFEREADSSIGNFKIVSKMSDDLKNLIKSNTDSLLSIRNVQNGLKSVKEEMSVLYRMEENLKTLNIELSDLKSEHENEGENLKKYENGEEWVSFTELLERKKRKEEEISDLRSQIMQNISRTEKPLRKLKNLVDRGIVKVDDEKVLERYADSFFIAMVEEKNPETINSILKIVQKNISEGKIILKDKEKDLAEIEWILENNVFGNLLEKYLLLEDDLKGLEKNIDEQNALNIKNEMESRIGDLEKRMEMTSLEIEKVKKQIDKMKNSINERKTVLEESLTLLANKKIELNFIS
jgi:hypothetical protein